MTSVNVWLIVSMTNTVIWGTNGGEPGTGFGVQDDHPDAERTSIMCAYARH